MQKLVVILSLLTLASTGLEGQVIDNAVFRGQASGWLNVNPGNDLPVWIGARYIPQLNFDAPLRENRKFDFEMSANITGSSMVDPFDRFDPEGRIKPYRTWARYSSDQAELRLGLQKINFGSASMLRPLMWFDQVDPRDPLQLTDGVWGLLGRYYFLSNVNIWLWGLYGNQGPKSWEIGETRSRTPELGGRFQMPVPGGEAALTFHHRKADIRSLVMNMDYLPGGAVTIPDDYMSRFTENIPENRFGFDVKWDIEIGLWLEAAWIQKRKDLMQLTNQHQFTLGADYTFDIGNGTHLAIEHLLISMDIDPFELVNRNHFTAASLSYPLGIFDNINAIVYRDWTNEDIYSFVNWHRQFDRFSFYLIAFLNPESFSLPQQSEGTQMFSGRGLQIMIVFNH